MLLPVQTIRVCPPGVRPPTGGRRGVVAAWALLALLFLTAVLVGVVEIYRLPAARVEMQTSADAAALAAARELVDDRFLIGDPRALAERIAAARVAAHRFALVNGVFGDPVALDDNEANDAGGDVLLGRLDAPRAECSSRAIGRATACRPTRCSSTPSGFTPTPPAPTGPRSAGAGPRDSASRPRTWRRRRRRCSTAT